MKLSNTTGADPNRLPYFLTDSAGNRVPVEFALLAASDKPEIEGADWLGAIYREVWIAYCNAPGTLKLTPTGASSPILGLLRPGALLTGESFLRKSLLESAPALRYCSRSVSPVRGVGRVLVARLVIESYNQGVGGAVAVDARREAFGFYRRLGFVGGMGRLSVHRLFVAEAENLFVKATL